MTREELIKAIYDNDDAWSCPDYHCDKPEEEGNSGECCLKCAEKQLKAYEDKIITSFEYSITSEIKKWYWDADKQALANDPCVVDALIDLFIRTIHDTAKAQ